MKNAVIHPTTGANMEYRGLIADKETLPTWDRAAANEFGRLAQGVGGSIEGSSTIYYQTKQSRMVALWWMCALTKKKFTA
jgi:hypothetical protein